MRFACRVALAAGALSLMMLAVAVGVGQGQSAQTGQTATAPSQLTEEYPLGKRKLCCDENGTVAPASAKGSPGRSDGPSDGNPLLWLLLLAPLAVLGFLVWLVAYTRSGPPTAYGYALGNEPRRRRRVPPSVIRALTPLFAYNHHRDAYVLRGIGNRRGPVLRVRHEGAEPWAVRPATLPPAAAPMGVRGGGGPARVVREPVSAPVARPAPAAVRPVEKPPPAARSAPAAKPAADSRPRRTPARATPNGGAPANGTTPERATGPAPTPAEAPTQPPAPVEREEPRDTDAVAAPKAKPKSGKGKAGKKGKAAKAGKNGKGKKAPAAPRANKPKAKAKAAGAEKTPALTDALAAGGKAQSARAKRRAAYRARQGGGAGSPERNAGSEEQRSAPTGRFKRDESGAAPEDRPPTKTRE
jgi:hypothetical protein